MATGLYPAWHGIVDNQFYDTQFKVTPFITYLEMMLHILEVFNTNLIIRHSGRRNMLYV